MIGIPRHAKNPDLSWKLIEHLYLSDRSPHRPPRPQHDPPAAAGGLHPPRLPLARPLLRRPTHRSPLRQLAPTIPPRYVSPLTVAAQIAVSVVLSRAVDEVREHNPPPAQLEAQCAAWLKEMDKGLRARLAHGRLGTSVE